MSSINHEWPPAAQMMSDAWSARPNWRMKKKTPSQGRSPCLFGRTPPPLTVTSIDTARARFFVLLNRHSMWQALSCLIRVYGPQFVRRVGTRHAILAPACLLLRLTVLAAVVVWQGRTQSSMRLRASVDRPWIHVQRLRVLTSRDMFHTDFRTNTRERTLGKFLCNAGLSRSAMLSRGCRPRE